MRAPHPYAIYLLEANQGFKLPNKILTEEDPPIMEDSQSIGDNQNEEIKEDVQIIPNCMPLNRYKASVPVREFIPTRIRKKT